MNFEITIFKTPITIEWIKIDFNEYTNNFKIENFNNYRMKINLMNILIILIIIFNENINNL